MRTDDLDFELPTELIAQAPAERRDESRLLHYRKLSGALAHRRFSDLPSMLRAGDLLVFNDAQVVPARFTLRKSTGGRVEGLFIAEVEPGVWRAMLRNASGTSGKLAFIHAPDVTVEILSQEAGGEYCVRVDSSEPAMDFLSRVGRMPLPPYIKRDKDHDARDEFDRQRYQTVYARTPGAVAAPTAGLHFDEDLFRLLDAKGIQRSFITLHVGLGTFKPVESDTLDGHRMHTESYSISQAAADDLNAARQAKSEGRRIIAVGTTAARVLESQPADAAFVPKSGETSIFIYPPYAWKHVDALITNFHLPRSTLIALVAAMVGLEEQRRIYHTAIQERYRFFSYGDAMLIE
jgi:S-adenosylmethionine:tRNA ribosyltransferase-isomerase